MQVDPQTGVVPIGVLNAFGFARLTLGQPLSVLAGEGDQDYVLSARVIEAGRDELMLRLVDLPPVREALAAGSYVHVLDAHGLTARALVVRLEEVPAPVLLLERLPAPPSARRQRGFRRSPGGGATAYLSVIRGERVMRLRTQLLDLSAGGARLLAPKELDASDRLGVHLPPVEDCPGLNLPARVAWVRSLDRHWQVGVEFGGVRDAERELLRRMVFLLRWRDLPVSEPQ